MPGSLERGSRSNPCRIASETNSLVKRQSDRFAAAMPAAPLRMPAARTQTSGMRMRGRQLPAIFHALLGHAGTQRPGQGSLHSRTDAQQHMHYVVCAAASETGIVDRTLYVKFSLAQTSNRLDLSECELETVPPEVLELKNLEVPTFPSYRYKDGPSNTPVHCCCMHACQPCVCTLASWRARPQYSTASAMVSSGIEPGRQPAARAAGGARQPQAAAQAAAVGKPAEGAAGVAVRPAAAGGEGAAAILHIRLHASLLYTC